MSSIVEEIRQFLPLVVTTAELDPDGVYLDGKNWRLRVNTQWRLTENGKKTIPLADLVGDEVVDTRFQPHKFGMDLLISTRDGREFEIISDFPYGEWIFSVWHTGDERRIPIFDLDGPFASDLI